MTNVRVQQGGINVSVGSGIGTTVKVRPSDSQNVPSGTPVQNTVSVTSEIAVQVSPGSAPAPVIGYPTQGPAGPPGPAGGAALVRVADGPIGGYRVVRSLDAARVGYADSSQPTHGDDTIGITQNAAIDGDNITVVTQGPISFNGWALTPGAPIYLGTNGLITQNAPETGFVQTIGHAEDATTVFVDIEPATYL